MATDIRLKKSSVAGRIPDSSNLDYGELALNYQDGKLYYKSAGGGVNAFLDSAGVDALIASKQGLDSAGVTSIIDSDYIQARQVDLQRDSAFITNIVDSDYVLNRSSASFPILNQDSSLSHYQKMSFSVLTDAGGVVVLQPQVTYQDSGGNDVLININLSKGDFSDSASVISLIDSDHVQLRQDFSYGSLTGTPTIPSLGTDFIDSAEAIKLITANAIDSSVALQLLLDSIETINLIDSSYIQLRVPETYLATIIDSDYISDRQAAGTDSSTVITLIQSTVDSAYVQAREDNAGGGGGGGGTTGSFNQVTVNSYTGDSSTTAFTLSQAPTSGSENNVVVTINGVVQHTNSYSLSGLVVTLDSAPETGDEIEMRVHDDYSANIQLRDYKSYVYTPSVSTTAFSGADDNGATLAYDDGKVEVFLNGSRLVTGLDYTETNSSTITLGEAIDSGDTLEIVSVAKAAIADFGVAAYDSDFLTTDSDQIIHTFPAASFRTVKYIIQIEHDSDNKYHSEEILLAHNGTTVGMTTYSQVLLDSNLGTFDADISGGNVRLKFTPEYTNTSVKARAIRVNA